MKVNIERGLFNRWILVRADDRLLAWSGSRWVVHHQGLSATIPASNFDTLAAAVVYADEAGFEIAEMGARNAL